MLNDWKIRQSAVKILNTTDGKLFLEYLYKRYVAKKPKELSLGELAYDAGAKEVIMTLINLAKIDINQFIRK